MKNNIINRFTQSGKWKDFINFKSFECKVSFFISLLFVLFIYVIDVYNNLEHYLVDIQNITLYIVQALIGAIGMIIAGVAIVMSVFNKEVMKQLKKLNRKEDIRKIFDSFEFLAFNIGIAIMIFLLVHISLFNDKVIVPKFFFYLLFGVLFYFFSFIIFYSISLISNTIKIFFISDTYSEINDYEKNIFIQANEIRIDYIIKSLFNGKVTKEEFLSNLEKHLEASDVDDEEAIRQYFKKYYS
ncbi:hypothetical protein RAH41_18470 [Gottfriedia acidiceleris]|uniref:hypothetical protein n=1 Tax=Gottfriedia acidiceleris TaxID=371036 RepID=UPI002F262EBA